MMPEPSAPALEAEQIVKRFGAFCALDGVDLQVLPGEVHALLGENGAGKTTLMNMACGLFRPDGGTIRIEGQPFDGSSPREAARRGLGMVHQHFRLVESFTVAENVHLGWEGTPTVASAPTLERRTAETAERLGMPVDPRAKIWQLSIGQKQTVAILRALARGARTLILDEPTAVLSPQESEALFVNVRALAAEGRTIIIISHKLRETLDVADRITVLRAGRRVATTSPSETSVQALVKVMVGEDVAVGGLSRAGERGDPVLVAESLWADGDRGLPAMRGVDLEIAAREVVGVASVSGNGAWELAEVVTGLRPLTSGSLAISDRRLDAADAGAFIDAGVGHVPESHAVGLALGAPIEFNAAMKAVRNRPIRQGLLIDRAAIRSLARELLDRANLPHVHPQRHADTLSGGQAQRLIIQRELRAGRRLLVAAYPSRGLDIAATDTVQRALVAARDDGVGVLVISEDLDELFRVSDRIVVMFEGRLVGEFGRHAFDRERIGFLMTGGENALAAIHLGRAR